MRISRSHPISPSSRQEGENAQLWKAPYFFVFLKFGNKGFIVFVLLPLENLVPLELFRGMLL